MTNHRVFVEKHNVLWYALYVCKPSGPKQPMQANLGLLPELVVHLVRRRTHGLLLQQEGQEEVE